MIKKCSRCGAPAPDDIAVFCNRCGTRLPSVLHCRRCGKPVTDPLSRFCDHCGSPLAPAVQAVPPVTPAKGNICPACGFENFVEDACFCKKCGSVLGKNASTGTMPEGRSAVRREPVRMPAAAQPQPLNPPARAGKVPVSATAVVPDTPRVHRQDGPQRGGRRSWKKIALAVAAIIVLIIVIIAVLFIVPGISGDRSDNATVPDLPGVLARGIMPGSTQVINQGTPVITDAPVKKK
jgi:hypothetical protein